MAQEGTSDQGRPVSVHGAPPSQENVSRIKLVRLFFLAFAFLIAARLIQLQVDPGAKLSQTELNHITTVPISVPRGNILDSANRILATDRQVPSLWADPRIIADPAATARHVAAALSLDEKEIYDKLTQRNSNGQPMKFVWLHRWMGEAELAALGDLSDPALAGLHVKREPTRFYPQKELAANVLGFVNRERTGSGGIELTHDKFLRSEPGERTARVDGKRNLLASLTLEYTEPEGGDDVQLTIDSAVQHSLEQALDQAMIDAKAPRAMGLIMNPKTGAIIALACRPAFDPNRYWDFDENLLKNTALSDVFEPGSAFKIVAAAAAIECGLVTPETMINCHNGSYVFYRHRIKDYHALGVEPFRTCFAQSSNIAIISVATWLGEERFASWIDRFGFGSKTSRDFEWMESKGIFRPQSEWTPYSMGALPMGQEIAVTMPQLAVSFSVIANGGFKVEPYVVERAVSRDGMVTHQHRPAPPKRIISSETAATMRDLMHTVVSDPEGTGRYANIEKYRVAGKTGTAQMALPTGGYSPDKYTAVFAGFAPVADPKLCAVIVVQEPGIKLHYGGYVCGPVFKKVIEEALSRMGCPEDPVQEPLPEGTQLVADADTVTARIELEPLDMPAEFLLETSEGLKLVTQYGDGVVDGPVLPDFKGMTKKRAQARLAALGIRWDLQGTGWVVSQDPPANTPLTDVSVCRLVFANKTKMIGIEGLEYLTTPTETDVDEPKPTSPRKETTQIEDGTPRTPALARS